MWLNRSITFNAVCQRQNKSYKLCIDNDFSMVYIFYILLSSLIVFFVGNKGDTKLMKLNVKKFINIK